MDNAEASRNPAAARTVGEGADGQLLERFVDHRDEAAFAALVKRFGPLVLGVCRRVLRHEQDAEDAFQATFLVLVRNARSIQQRESVGSWLYGVAYRIARRAKGIKARRPVEELTPHNITAPESSPDWLVRDLRPVLDEEINRLPPKFRAPFVLCHVEGQTNEQAARQLGCPVGTVLSRLSRARGRLRARLGRRGLALPGALLAATLAEALARAAVSSSMVKTIAKAAILQAGGKTGGKGAFSPKAVALAKAFSKSRWKLKLACAVGVVFVLALIGLYFLIPGKGTNVPPVDSANVVVPKVKPVKIDDKEKLQGVWRAEKVEMGGKEMPAANDFRAIFAGEKLNVNNGDAKGPNWTFVLDQTKQPKAITIRTDKGETQLGIYDFDGEKLKLFVNHGGQRPTNFSAAPAPTMILFVFRRESAAVPKTK
jgi:RNA polymerase sigma factor (sigma-70 family)